jgi:hypothetical protein
METIAAGSLENKDGPATAELAWSYVFTLRHAHHVMETIAAGSLENEDGRV